MMGMPDKARRLNWPILIGMLLTLNLALLLTPQAMVDLSPPPMPTSTCLLYTSPSPRDS